MRQPSAARCSAAARSTPSSIRTSITPDPIGTATHGSASPVSSRWIAGLPAEHRCGERPDPVETRPDDGGVDEPPTDPAATHLVRDGDSDLGDRSAFGLDADVADDPSGPAGGPDDCHDALAMFVVGAAEPGRLARADAVIGPRNRVRRLSAERPS